ncbi:MAG: DUF3795 domain-containing protein [Candidatus Bathyarchaeia archaeon]|nr:DUF3795 domain-containing protein [Candidatus Bathyarchaeota archaeon]
MKPIIACCGLTCSLCEAYLATQNNDNEERKKIAEKWSKVLNTQIKPEQIDCDGCISNGRLFLYCQTCEKRKCCMERNLENCAYCDDYPCYKLEGVFKNAPYVKTTLDEIRAKLTQK